MSEKKIGKESNVYFHPLKECVNKWAPMFIPSLLTFHPTDIRETFFVQEHNDFIRDKLQSWTKVVETLPEKDLFR